MPCSCIEPPVIPVSASVVDDREILDRIRVGDIQAFETLFRQTYDPLVRFAYSMLRSRAVAEEVVQELMLELWRRRETLRVAGPLNGYLFQSVRNRALNELRREALGTERWNRLHPAEEEKKTYIETALEGAKGVAG